jgi:hypothetical protein
LREQFEASGFKCDGAIPKAMTAREFLSWFGASFNIMVCTDRFGLLSAVAPSDPDPFMPVFDEQQILANTFFEDSPDPIANQIIYRFLENPAEGFFASWIPLDNLTDQYVRGFTDGNGARIRGIESEQLDQHFVRDADTARAVALERLRFESLGSFVQTFSLPFHLALDLDLGQWIGITHSQGLAEGGYVAQAVRIFHIKHDLMKMTTTLQTVRLMDITV